METITIPRPTELSYEQRDISNFKGFDWSKATKADAVSFSRAAGFKETGMSVNEVALLYDLLEQKRPRVIVELSRNYGTSTRLFMQYLMRHNGMLDSWDLKHWPGFIEIMAENGYKFETFAAESELYLWSKKYPSAVNDTGAWLRVAHSIKTPVSHTIESQGVDFLLIDTEHGIEHALGEYMRWREYLNSGAMVAFHDSTLPAVARAIELVKEIEEKARTGHFKREYRVEQEDGFGVLVLES